MYLNDRKPMFLIPNKSQWEKWSLPSKLTAIGAYVGIIGIIFTLIIYLLQKNDNEVVLEDNLKITGVRSIIDQPTMIQESTTISEGKAVQSGIMSLYWEVLLSNIGVNDLSVIRYDILQVGKDFPVVSYTYMKQGIYKLKEGSLIPAQFPITIPAGHTIALFLRVGIEIDKRAYQLIRKEFANEKRATLETIVNFLRLKGLDFYGNEFKKMTSGAYSLPPINHIREQVFGLSFTTGRGSKTHGFVSWYKFGLFRNSLQGQ